MLLGRATHLVLVGGNPNSPVYGPLIGRNHWLTLTIVKGSHSLDQAYTLFGRPKSITAFYRSQRGLESEIEDSFTVILQYDRNQKNLLVTVKSAITTPLAKQLKLFVRGSEGSFVKVR